MADPVTLADVAMLAAQHNDIRTEAVDHTNEIVKEGLKGDYGTLGAIKDSRYETTSRVEGAADRIVGTVTAHNSTIVDRFFDVGRDTADLKAQIVQTLSEIRLVGAATARDTEIAVLKSTIEAQKNTQFLSDKIAVEGDRTRALINDLKTTDLNRMLIERNAEIHEERHHGRHWRGAWDQSQYAAIHSQMQAMNSQFAETRQGMVNFGTMAGVGQSSTSNNVR